MKFFILTFILLLTLAKAQDVSWYNASNTKFEISTAEQLKGLAKLVNDGTSHFGEKTITLIDDITLTEDFIPIGKDSVWNKTFLGTFDGNGHSISGLSVSNPRVAGLFGFIILGGQIKNLTVNASKIKATGSGRVYAGVLAAFYKSAMPIENCYVIADSVVASNIDSVSVAGGLVGYGGGKISNSYSIANILATGKAPYSGGLAGAAALAIENSFSIGNVSAIGSDASAAGGLVGYGGDITYSGSSLPELVRISKTTISNSYSIGNILASSPHPAAGGLVAIGIGATEISRSYSTGDASANGSTQSYAGGLIGMMLPMGGSISISNSYSAGDVLAVSNPNVLGTLTSFTGGLVGYVYMNSSYIVNSYANGNISGGNFGGIFGQYGGGEITSVYYNSEGTSQAAGQGSPAGIEAKSMNELKMKETFAGWDFDYVWKIEETSVPPFLSFWFPILDDIEYFKILDQTYTGSQIKLQPIIHKKNGTLLFKGIDYELGYGENKNVGSGTINVIGKNAYSSISKTITFKILPKELTVTGAVAQNKIYDGTDVATITGATLKGVANEDDVSLSNSTIGTFESVNASPINISGNIPVSTNMLLIGESAANYSLIQPQLGARITQKILASDAIEPIDNQDYTGLAIKPVIIVKDNTRVLILGTDYTLEYSNNINPGTATVEAAGIGNYGGRVTKSFTIIGEIPSSSSSNNDTFSSSSNGSTSAFFLHIATANSAIPTHNAINLHIQNTAYLQIYNLNGKLQKSLNFKSGVYNVPLGDLPKGIYIVNVKFSNPENFSNKMLRIVVK